MPNVDSSEPSLPIDGPENKLTSKPGFGCNPNTDATVFSWAPPTISRVMTCVTRILSLEVQEEPPFNSFSRALINLLSSVLGGAYFK